MPGDPLEQHYDEKICGRLAPIREGEFMGVDINVHTIYKLPEEKQHESAEELRPWLENTLLGAALQAHLVSCTGTP